MVALRFQGLRGTRPKTNATLLPEGLTQTAENVNLSGGTVSGMLGLVSQEVLSDNLNDSAATAPTFFNLSKTGEKWMIVDNMVDILEHTKAPEYRVTDITKASSAVITIPNHNLATGDVIQLKNIPGMTEVNDRDFVVGADVVAGTSFYLMKADGTTNVNSSGYTTFTSGLYGRAIDVNGNKFIWVGDGYPKQGTLSMIVNTGTSRQPYSHLRLGIPRPTQAVTLGYIGAETDDGTETEWTTNYVYSYVNRWGDESQPSPPSATWDKLTGNTGVNVSDLPDASQITADMDGSTQDIDYIRVYRLVAGTNYDTYMFVKDIAVGTTSFDDTAAQDDLSEACPSTAWVCLPSGLTGMVHYSQNIYMGWVNNELWVTEPYVPYAAPYLYSMTFPYNIVGLGQTGTVVVVLTNGYPYIVSGQSPLALSQTKLDKLFQPCLSRRSIVSHTSGVIYAGTDGLYLITGNGQGVNLTKDIYTKIQWNALGTLANLHGVLLDNTYYGFFFDTATGFVLDLNNPTEITTFNLGATHLFRSCWTDGNYIYIMTTTSAKTAYTIYQFDTGSSLTYTVRTKDYEYPKALNFSKARVVATSYSADDISFKLYVDGVLKYTKSGIDSDAIFPLPSGFRGRKFSIEISGTDEFLWAGVATTASELQ